MAISPRNTHQAFSLVEVTLALGIAAFSGLVLIGMLSLGLSNAKDSKQQLQAATIAESLCSTRRAAPTYDFTTNTVQVNFPIPPLNSSVNNFTSPIFLDSDGRATTAANARFGFLYRIIPNFYSIPTGTTTGFSTVYLCFYWPAQASPPNSSAGHFEVTTTIPLQ